MSTFAVTVEKIGKVWAHPNAERLELASLEGMSFQFCVPKDEYSVGDLVVYFPVDSLLPEEVIKTLGLEGKLSGKDKNRVKTIKLRGEISQGVVAYVRDLFPSNGFQLDLTFPQGEDVTELLGVTKYEPEPVSVRDGRLVPLPQLVQKYDIEGADRYPEIIEMLLDEHVVVTEKLEGSHFSASLYTDGDFAVCQRNYRIIPTNKKHDWHRVAEEYQLQDAMKQLSVWLKPVHVITLRGEMLGPGIQGNIYGLPNLFLRFFEIEVDGVSIDPYKFTLYLYHAGLQGVPILHDGTLRDFLAGRTVQEASNGMTVLQGAKETMREGIVIRPVKEQWDQVFGRVLLKQRSPEYLAKYDL